MCVNPAALLDDLARDRDQLPGLFDERATVAHLGLHGARAGARTALMRPLPDSNFTKVLSAYTR